MESREELEIKVTELTEELERFITLAKSQKMELHDIMQERLKLQISARVLAESVHRIRQLLVVLGLTQSVKRCSVDLGPLYKEHSCTTKKELVTKKIDSIIADRFGIKEN